MLNGKRILIQSCPGLGDLIVFTPSFKALKRQYPECILSVVSYERNLPIVSRLPYVDHVYGIKKGHFLGNACPAVHLLQQDYVIFTTWQSQLARLARLVRVPHRSGVCKEKYRNTRLFEHNLPWDDFDEKMFRADFVAKLLSIALEVPLETDGICEISEPTEGEWETARKKLSEMGRQEGREYVAIAPFANTEKNIPAELVAGAIGHIASRYGMDCVFVHGRPMPNVKQFQTEAMAGHVFDLCGRTSLMEMVAVLRHARFVFSANSGPMHIACAMQMDTAVIFSNDNRIKWQPRKHCFPITLNLPCAPCDDRTERQCEHKRCSREITLEMVTATFDKIMA